MCYVLRDGVAPPVSGKIFLDAHSGLTGPFRQDKIRRRTGVKAGPREAGRGQIRMIILFLACFGAVTCPYRPTGWGSGG
jgi:hypothetical protein